MEDWTVEWLNDVVFIWMNQGIVLNFKDVTEDVTFQEVGDTDTFLEKLEEDWVEQEVECEGVLVLDDVFDNGVKSSNLIVLKGNIQGWHLNCCSINDMSHFIENWVLSVEFLGELKGHKCFNDSWVKG